MLCKSFYCYHQKKYKLLPLKYWLWILPKIFCGSPGQAPSTRKFLITDLSSLKQTLLTSSYFVVFIQSMHFKEFLFFLFLIKKPSMLCVIKISSPLWLFSTELPISDFKVKRMQEDSMNSISSPSVKIQIIGRESFQKFVDPPSNVLPLHLMQTFPPITWIFTEGDRIKSRLLFKILSTFSKILVKLFKFYF